MMWVMRVAAPALLAALLGGAAAARDAAAQATPSVADLPLVEVPVRGAPAGGLVAVLLTADGGWAPLDRGVAADLSAAGVPVVGWSSLDYYRTPRTPEQAAGDLARVLRHYLPAWGGRRVLLVGYSFGADVLPLLVNRLPADLRGRVAGVTLISFSGSAVFQFHVAEWLGVVRGRRYPALAELQRVRDVPVLCVFGHGDTSQACGRLGMPNATLVAVDAGHRMGSVTASVGGIVAGEARRLAREPAHRPDELAPAR